MKEPKILVILGPTTSGKSDLAVKLAKEFNGEVISADSRQVYKGLDIGTGKITKREMMGVPHYMLDVVSPRRQFTVAEYAKKARIIIENIFKRGKLPIICGGAGFYIAALLGEGNFPDVPSNPILRKKLAAKTPEVLFAILKKMDSVRALKIDPHNKVRLIRAIEIARVLGKVPKHELESMHYKVCKIGIKAEKEKLKKRIRKRLMDRLRKGMVREARWLHKRGLSYKRMRELGLEYRRLADFLEVKINKQDLLALLQNEIWQYAKRQMTWFQRDKDIIWLEPRLSSIKKIAKEFLNRD
jgi:tRNA dimethylallyltransferase